MADYPPKHYLEDHWKYHLEIIRLFPLAAVISIDSSSQPVITHFPLIWQPTERSIYGKLIGHADANNPHLSLLNNNVGVTAIFSGPDTYISPNDYFNNLLPTWNYIKVHIKGRANWLSREAEHQSFIDMCNYFEGLRDTGYKLKFEDKRIPELLPYIRGFEIIIDSSNGKFKLAKEKSGVDKIKARDVLLSKTYQHLAEMVTTIIGENRDS